MTGNEVLHLFSSKTTAYSNRAMSANYFHTTESPRESNIFGAQSTAGPFGRAVYKLQLDEIIPPARSTHSSFVLPRSRIVNRLVSSSLTS